MECPSCNEIVDFERCVLTMKHARGNNFDIITELVEVWCPKCLYCTTVCESRRQYHTDKTEDDNRSRYTL